MIEYKDGQWINHGKRIMEEISKPATKAEPNAGPELGAVPWYANGECAESARVLAMMALQSERYASDPGYRNATDAVLAWAARGNSHTARICDRASND